MSKIRNTRITDKAFDTLTTLSNQPKIEKTSAIPVYEHVHILWRYKEAKINIQIFDDFSLIVSL